MQNLKIRLDGLIDDYPDAADAVFTVLRFLGVFLAGLLLTQGRIVPSLAPFAAAYAMSVSFSYLPAAAGGAILSAELLCAKGYIESK